MAKFYQCKPLKGHPLLAKGSFVAALLMLLLATSCRKTETFVKKELYLKQIPNDSLGGYFDNTISQIITLPDNSFWIHYRIRYFPPFEDRFEHYDRNFKLLKTVKYYQYKFGKFVVNGTDDIVVPAAYIGSSNLLEYHFLRFDRDFIRINANNSINIMSNLQPLKSFSWNTFLTRQKNGEYIFGFFTTDGFPGSDSARMITASYDEPYASSIPNWVEKNKFKDPALGIDHNSMVDIAADNQNQFYVLGMSTGYAFTLRKHAADGSLIWQRKIPNTQHAEVWYCRIYVEPDRVLVTSTLNKMYIFDLDGNYTEKKLTYKIAGEIRPTSDGSGYVAVSDTAYASAKFATLLKFNRNFDLIKVKRYGNQGTNNASAARFNRMADGNFIVAGFVETANLKGVNLMLFKMDNELELTD